MSRFARSHLSPNVRLTITVLIILTLLALTLTFLGLIHGLYLERQQRESPDNAIGGPPTPTSTLPPYNISPHAYHKLVFESGVEEEAVFFYRSDCDQAIDNAAWLFDKLARPIKENVCITFYGEL